MREESFVYNDKIQDEILKFMGNKIQHDYLQGNREVSLDLTVAEASKLYNASDSVRAAAESGQLQALHQKIIDQGKAIEVGYIKVMDQLDRTLQQISEAEQDIYDDLVDADIEELHRLDDGKNKDALFNFMGSSNNTVLENYEIVKRVATEKGDSDVINAEKSLKSLLNTRARVMNAKADLQDAVIANVGSDAHGACEQEVREFRETARQYGFDAQDGAEADDSAYSKQFNDIE